MSWGLGFFEVLSCLFCFGVWGFFCGFCTFLLLHFHIQPNLNFHWKERSTFCHAFYSTKFYSSCCNSSDGTSEIVMYYSSNRKLCMGNLPVRSLKEEETMLFNTLLLW